jgi:hypothetical protein
VLTAASTTRHYVANEDGAYAATTALGFDVHDTGMSASEVNALPSGTQAMVWAENGKCPSSLSSTFTSFVSAQASNPKVYGYYLVDEPQSTSGSCVTGIRAMADYIHANAPGKQAFIVLTDYPGTYAAYAPASSHADLVGIDPYPCRRDTGTCDYAEIDRQVSAAVNAGVPRTVLVPTYQAFGDSTWSPPSATQLQAILTEWAKVVPSPVLDYAYSWGCQGGSLTSCLSGSTAWQDVFRTSFAGSSTSPTPSPTPSPTASTPTPSPTTSTPTPSPTPTSPTTTAKPTPTPSPSPSPTPTRTRRPHHH